MSDIDILEQLDRTLDSEDEQDYIDVVYAAMAEIKKLRGRMECLEHKLEQHQDFHEERERGR